MWLGEGDGGIQLGPGGPGLAQPGLVSTEAYGKSWPLQEEQASGKQDILLLT